MTTTRVFNETVCGSEIDAAPRTTCTLLRAMYAWSRTGLAPASTDLDPDASVDELIAADKVGGPGGDENRWRQFEAATRLRDTYIEAFGFVIPTPALIARLAREPVLDVAAGSGHLARLIALAGGDVVANDPGAHADHYAFETGGWYPLECLDAADAVRRHPERTVLLSWPTRGEWPTRCLEAMAPGARLVLIGEDRGGCTGDDRFFDALENGFELGRGEDVVRFAGIHDRVVFATKHA